MASRAQVLRLHVSAGVPCEGISTPSAACTAQHEGRLLLTRYDQLAEHRHAAGTVILLSSETLEECIKELCAFVSIDWQYNPFSRCIGCNQPVESAIASEQPQETHSYFCPTCNQVYWYNDLPHNQPRHAWPQKLSR